MRQAIALLLGAVLFGAAAAQAGDVSATPASGGGLKIGYVDLGRTLRQYHKRQELEQNLRVLQASLSEENEAKVSEWQKYRQEIEQLVAGTPDRLELEEKHRKASIELEKLRRISVDRLNEEFVDMIEQLYGDIEREVEIIGREKDLDFVLKDQSRERRARTRDEAVLQISQRIVLYSKPEHDLTALVVQRLNMRYAAVREEAGKAEPEKPAKAEER